MFIKELQKVKLNLDSRTVVIVRILKSYGDTLVYEYCSTEKFEQYGKDIPSYLCGYCYKSHIKEIVL